MTEIYSSEPNLKKVVTEIQGRPTTPVPDLITGSVKATNDKKLYTLPSPLVFNQLDNGQYEYIIKQNLVSGFKFVDIDITYELEDYGVFQVHDSYEVVRRLINFTELNDILGEFAIEYPIFSEVETNVRKIIESYCNQDFNYWIGSQRVSGAGGTMSLPEHMDRLDAVSTYSDIMTNVDLVLSSPGFELSSSGFSVSNQQLDKTVSFFHNSPRKTNYEVTGLWGYASIPTAVRQAAIELIRNFLCDDIEYRRRYIDNIRSGDVRIQFNPAAYEHSTGNPIADDLLKPYVRLLYGAV